MTEDGIVQRMDFFAAPGNGVNTYGIIWDALAPGGLPGAILGRTVAIAITDPHGNYWMGGVMTAPVALSAGDYYLGATGDADSGPDIRAYHLSGLVKRKQGTNFYLVPPNPFGTPNLSSRLEMCIYATYDLPATGMPVGYLKKGLVSGFHCFMSGYLTAKNMGVDPLKLPDGTVF